MLDRSSLFAVLLAVGAGVGLGACASYTPPPIFSTQSPADPKAPAAPVTKVEPLGQPPAGPPTGAKPSPSPAPAQGAAAYTCTMHPQVKSDRPGSCPVCGMSLVKAKTQGNQP